VLPTENVGDVPNDWCMYNCSYDMDKTLTNCYSVTAYSIWVSFIDGITIIKCFMLKYSSKVVHKALKLASGFISMWHTYVAANRK